MEALSSVLILLFLGSALLLAHPSLSLIWPRPIHRRPLPPALPATAVMALVLQGCLRRCPDIKLLLRRVFATYGPIITLRLGTSHPTIVVADATVAGRALVANGASFAGRPPALETSRPLITAVSAAYYGPPWCALRRNLASGILHSSAVKSYAASRRRVVGSLLWRLGSDMQESVDGAVTVRDQFLHAMFSLLSDMVFGASALDGDAVKGIQDAHQVLLSYYNGLAFGFLPKMRDSLLPTSMTVLPKLRRIHEQMFLPMIRSRRQNKENMQQQQQQPSDQSSARSYVDTLIDLEFPDNNGGCRNLDDNEIVTFCSEFLSAGAETTSTALEWIMANVTKHQSVQRKLVEEILEGLIGEQEEIKEENIHRMEYLSAVVMEGLRRHPPAHFLLPHSVSSDVTIGGYFIPRDSTVHFMVGDMGLDKRVWRNPLEFMPERFLHGGECHRLGLVTGREDIKMMPFGAGRRTCPAVGMALFLLRYFVANLVKEFEWEAAVGEEIDLSDKLGLTVPMKHPLRARLYKRMPRQVLFG